MSSASPPSDSYNLIEDVRELYTLSIESYLGREKEYDEKIIQEIGKTIKRYENTIEFYKSECERFKKYV